MNGRFGLNSGSEMKCKRDAGFKKNNSLFLLTVVKNFLYTLGLLSLLASCASTQTAYPGSTSAAGYPPKQKPDEPPKFLENISIKAAHKSSASIDKPLLIKTHKDVPGSRNSPAIEKCHYLQFKYAILLEETVESMTNDKLISFLEYWYGAPYRYGGYSKKGIDCSAFTSLLMDSVFNIALPRTAKSQYVSGKRIKKNQLGQGDLVFFNTTGGISHVGVYLANNKFVHASTSMGVIISDIDDVYFKRRYVGASRVK